MPQDAVFVDLMARLRVGDRDAANEVFQRFARRLIGLARTHLDQLTRQKVDPEDVLQSVFKSFFPRQAGGAFDLDGWDSLWNLLVVLTLRKCGHKIRHFRTAGRDVQRETKPSAAEELGVGWEALVQDPTPSAVLMLAESVEQMTRSLPDRQRPILSLSLQGYSPIEIGIQLE